LEELPGWVGEPQGAQSLKGYPVLAGEVEEDLTTSVVVAHNSNLILQRGQHSDIDERKGDAILISDQVIRKDNNSRLKASRSEPSTCPQPLISYALKQQRCRCGRCYGMRLQRWRIDVAAA
jgi:hypothetical protein